MSMNATKHLTALCAAFLFACSTDSPDVTGVTVVDNTMAQNESSSSEKVSSSSEMETSSSSIKTPSSSSQEDKKSSSSGIVIPPKASCKPPALTHMVTFGVVDAFIQKRVDVLKNLGLDQEAAKDSATEELYRELGLDTLFVDRPMITDDQLEYTLYYLYKSSEHANELSPDIVEDFADGTLDTTNFCVLDTSFEALDNMPFEYMDLGCFIGYELPNTIAILRNIWRKCHDMPYCNESIKDTVIPVGNDHFVCEGAYWTTLEIQGKMKNGVLCDENGTRVEDNGTYICYEGYWRSMTQTQDMPAEYFFNPDFEYGSFTDSRDGHVYKTTVFEGQTWLAQDIDYYDSSDTLLVNQSLCAKNGPYNLGNKSDNAYCDGASRFYTVHASKKACPEGWRLPTKEDWNFIVNMPTSESRSYLPKLFASTSTEGKSTDVFGMSLRTQGVIDPYGSRIENDYYNIFWIEEGIYILNSYNWAQYSTLFNDSRENGEFAPVRCIKK